ncbi:hypothetical protein IGB42_02468 [Andreprevotia sp. IGB-42]|uniref:DUF1365 domain-containing protein n=1 Tax=Andreprevotia sp. IGB-42 TaxID=2497473 RepID=UPI001358D656|nr:DUF1365 domain-containing protein [Andreprevotia sp. IGB-42]KAF0813068.1 hypothetical protein IGB42_02468 [Andreprevotia sp. IGB-42]
MSAAELIIGQVMHERLRPVRNHFVYPVFYLRVDLARLAELNNRWFGVDHWRPLGIRTADYGPRDGSDLQAWMRAVLRDAGLPSDGCIQLQTFPRLFGYAFNPVSFWYCHDHEDRLRAVLAEVSNTFGERHSYLLCAGDGGQIDADSLLVCRKVFHVSPFCKVEGEYRFRFRDSGALRFVSIDYHDADGVLLHTAIGGRSAPFTTDNLRRVLWRQPLLILGVVARIHWQAFRLWRNKVPFHSKPEPPAHALSCSAMQEKPHE